MTMYQTIIFPDFDKLDYLPEYQKKYIDEEKEYGYVLQIDDIDKQRYVEIFEGLKVIVAKDEYQLSEHFNEILLLSFIADSRKYDQLDFNFLQYFDETDKTEIAKVLLAYLEFVAYRAEREAKGLTATKPFTLSIHFSGFDTETTNKYFTEWILEQVYNAFENGKRPNHADIHASNFSDTPDGKMSLRKIREIANSKTKKPVGKIKKRVLVDFSKSIQKYLDHRTHLKTPAGKKLGAIQARLFFEILNLFGFIDEEAVTSVPADYLNSQYSKYG